MLASAHCVPVRHEPPGAEDGMFVNPHDRVASVVHVKPSADDWSETEMFSCASRVEPS
jgi:hypothetical protein